MLFGCCPNVYSLSSVNREFNEHWNVEHFLIVTRQVLGRPVCDRGAIPRTLVQSNAVRSRLIILINEEINEANGPDKIVAKKKEKKKSAKRKKKKKEKKTAKKKILRRKKKKKKKSAKKKSWRGKKKKKITKRIG